MSRRDLTVRRLPGKGTSPCRHARSPARRCRDHRTDARALRRGPDARGARPAGRAAPRVRRPAAGAARGPRRPRQAELAAGGTLDFLAETKDVREDDSWRVADARARAGGPPGRDHRADRPQDDHQRAQLRREGVAGRPRGRQHPAVGEHGRRPAQPARRHRAHDRLHLARRARPTRWATTARHHRRPAARLAPAEKHVLVDGERMSGSLFDFGLYFFHCAQQQIAQGLGPYFYLPKMESHLEARLWNDVFVARPGALGIPQGTIRATVLIETYPGRVRDGGDPLRAARPLRRAQRRPVGLHVQRHQEVPHPGPRLPAARPQLGDDDGAVHARLHRAAGAHLPQARRARDRRHGGVHPEQGRGGQRGRVREGPRRQDPRGRRRVRRLVGRSPRHGRDLPRGVRRGARRPAEPASTGSARTCHVSAEHCSTCARPPAT